MFPLVPAFNGLDAVVPVVTLPNASVTFPLASGAFPFTFCTAAKTSVTGIFDIVEKGLVPLPMIYPDKELAPEPPFATATVPVISVTGIFDIVEKGMVPLPMIYPVKEVDPDPPLATATVPVTLLAVPLVF